MDIISGLRVVLEKEAERKRGKALEQHNRKEDKSKPAPFIVREKQRRNQGGDE